MRLSLLAVLVVFARDGRDALHAQVPGISRDTLITLQPADSVLRLSNEFIIPGSVAIRSGSTDLVGGRDFLIDERLGEITLLHHIVGGHGGVEGDTSRAFSVTYRYLPIIIRPEYRKRRAISGPDTLSRNADTRYAPVRGASAGGFFGQDLRKSGSLVRGIQVGSTRDLTLNSGFRLQMSGRLTDDIDIVAALTDENSPIQPEGTTQTLQELDRVFIELRGRKEAVTLGDLTLDFRDGEFGKIRRKLRGALGSYSFSGGKAPPVIEAGAAVVRGKFSSYEFRGIEGVQGPYRLRGRENEYPIIVISGTERVYLDGRELRRGQLNDYVIDYSLGEVTFTTRTRITFASRIVVEFEYSDRRYARNLLGGRTKVALGSDGWNFGAMLVRENDDRNTLADISLSESDREILSQAGDSRTLASRSGIELVGPGKGRYLLTDTTVFYPALNESRDTAVLVYSPTDTLNAVYSAAFAFVGAGGDYRKISVGHYRYAGPGGGSYAPLRFLPLPEQHSFARFDAGGNITQDLSISGEYAVSDFDRNTFSTLDDADNVAGAYDVRMKFHREGIRFAGIGLSSLGLRARERRVQGNFVPLERYNEVEFNRNWNVRENVPSSEVLRDLEFEVRPVESLTLAGTAGWMRRGDRFSSDRFGASVGLAENLRYRFGYLASDDDAARRGTKRTTHEGTGRLRVGNIVPGISFRREHQYDGDSSLASPGRGSYAFTEIAPSISVDSLWGMGLSAEVGVRLDDSLRSERLVRVSESFFQTYGWRYDGSRKFSSVVDLQFQRRKFLHDTTGRIPESTLLVRSLTKIAPFGRGLEADLFYEASPERSARLERVFTRVAKGTGNYSYAGDLNGNGIVDNPDFRLTRFDGEYLLTVLPGDEYFPVVNLKASARLRVELSRFFTPGRPGVRAILSPISAETYVRIEEKSSDPEVNNVYFLRLATFRNPLTTLQGSSLFTQDLNLFENQPEFSLRFRYRQRKTLTKLSIEDETGYKRERGIRLTWSVSGNISNLIEFTEKRDFLAAGEGSFRNRAVRSTSIGLDWVYRPVVSVESGFGFAAGDAKNYDLSSASLNDQHLYVSYSLQNAGRLRAEIRREEALIRGMAINVPFELTGGRIAGKTWIWRFNIEYRLTQFLESSLRYEGRKEGKVSPNHIGSVEVRAFF